MSRVIVRIINHSLAPAPKIGLGDLVNTVAKPVARAIDFAFKTNMSGCKSCDERRKALNEFMPDIKKPLQ
jgi:hypothetical protein